MRKRAILLSLTLAAAVTDARAMTLEEAITTAVQNHPKVQGAAAGLKSAEADVDVERAGFLPSIDFRAGTGYDWVNNSTTRGRVQRVGSSEDPGVETIQKEGAITASQMLFDGFATWNATEAAEKRVSSANYQLLDAREAIGLRAAQAYLEVMRTREVVRLSEENVGRHLKTYDDLKAKAARGATSNADVQQSLNRYTTARSRLVQAMGAVRDAQAKFVEAVGSMPETLEDPEVGGAVPNELGEVVDTSVKNNPALNSARRNFEARDLDVETTRASFWPTVSLELASTRKDDASGIKGVYMEDSAMVVARYNLYRGGRDIARTQRALEQKSQAIQREAEIRRQLEQQAKMDFSAYTVAHDSTPIFSEKQRAASEVLDAYRQQFDLGRRSLLDLLDAEDDLYQAKVSLINAEFGTMDAKMRLLADMGQFLDTLKIAAEAAPAEENPQP